MARNAKNGEGRPESKPADSFERLIQGLEKLPGIGRRSAERMAYFLLSAPAGEAMDLAQAIRDVKQNLHPCTICGDLTESAQCAICSDPQRETGIICVVEWPRDARAIEKTGQFRGRFHVLMGRLSPLAGVDDKDLRTGALLQRIRAGGIRELILATSPTVEGDATAAWIVQHAKTIEPGLAVTRLARGVPSGSDLSFAQSGTLGEALRGRTSLASTDR